MKNKHKKRRIIFISTALLISIAALFFIIANFRDEIVFFYSPSELQSVEVLSKIKGKQFRVGGLVLEKTVKKIDALTTEFTISDLDAELKITYSGLVPDLFREGQGVVARGVFDSEKNQFIASELLVKHDEKYMPPEIVKKDLEARGRAGLLK